MPKPTHLLVWYFHLNCWKCIPQIAVLVLSGISWGMGLSFFHKSMGKHIITVYIVKIAADRVSRLMSTLFGSLVFLVDKSGRCHYTICKFLLSSFNSFRLELVSDILGLSLTCGSQKCPTTSLNLKNPVVLTFTHSLQLTVRQMLYHWIYFIKWTNKLLQEMLKSNPSKSTKCVFLDIPQTDQ